MGAQENNLPLFAERGIKACERVEKIEIMKRDLGRLGPTLITFAGWAELLTSVCVGQEPLS